MNPIYCPRCGAPVQFINGWWTCLRANDTMGPRLYEALLRIATEKPQIPEALRVRLGGTWHCPRDANVMEEKGGYIRCAECGRYLRGGLINTIIEATSHSAPT